MWAAILEAINKLLGIFKEKTPDFKQGRSQGYKNDQEKQDAEIDKWIDAP